MPQTRSVEKKVLTGFVTVLTLLGVVGIVSQRAITGLADDNRWVTHTHVVLETLQRISFQTTQAEAAARGYVLSGDPRFEAQYQQAKNSLPDLLRDLRQQTSDNPGQQAQIPTLESLIHERLQVMETASRSAGLRT